jgi:hypothetical protein
MTAKGLDAEPSRSIPAAYESQIHWYDSRALRYRRWYLLCESGLLFFASLTSVATTVHLWFKNDIHRWVWYIPILTSLVVVCLTGILNIFSFQHYWLNYRATCQKLQREARLFQVGGDVYASNPHPEKVLAERAEAIISQESKAWLEISAQSRYSPRKR